MTSKGIENHISHCKYIALVLPGQISLLDDYELSTKTREVINEWPVHKKKMDTPQLLMN